MTKIKYVSINFFGVLFQAEYTCYLNDLIIETVQKGTQLRYQITIFLSINFK